MKLFIKKSILVISVLQSVFMSPAFAKTREVEKPVEEYLAIATANTINRLGTVENYLKWISTRASDSEVARLEKYLAKMGVRKNQKFPRLKAIGAKVYFSSSEYMTYAPGEIVIEGKRFQQQTKSLDEVVQNIVEKLQKPRTAWYSLIVPEAHAMSSALSSALIGLVAGGALGYFAGPSLGTTKTEGALTGALFGSIAGLGVNYLGTESNYYLGNNGQVVCNGNSYYINNGNGSYFNNTSSNQQIPPGVVMRAYNGSRPCNVTNAAYTQANLQNWNQRYLVSNTTQTQHPGTILGVVQ